jgi:hypothetical protein
VTSHFIDFQRMHDPDNYWMPPLYQASRFFFINILAQGTLLFNFGFAIANKKNVMSSSEGRNRKNTTNLVKKNKQRRETLLDFALGGGSGELSDDEDDNEEYYRPTLFVSTGGNDADDVVPANPFKMGNKLRKHLNNNCHSP